MSEKSYSQTTQLTPHLAQDHHLKNGADLFCQALANEGVDLMFGIPGGVVLPLYDKLNKYGHEIKHILPRHEQAGGFAADGYARATGKVGVALGTSGPGATNLLTAIANSMMDSVPTVYITGQVVEDYIGTDAFQEVDVIGMTMPVVKHSYLVTRAEEIPRVVKEAFYLASTGRPGPVHIDLVKDVWFQETHADPDPKMDLPGYQPLPEAATGEEIKKLDFLFEQKKVFPGKLSQDSEPQKLSPRRATQCSVPNSFIPSLPSQPSSPIRPIIIAGHGVELSRAQSQLVTFAEKHNIPVVSTLLGLGNFPQGHQLWVGMIGMHGDAVANYAVHNSNLVIGIGCRFDDRITGKLDVFTKDKTFVHFEIDISEIGKTVPTALPIPGDLKDTLSRANTLLTNHEFPDWWAQIAKWKEKYGFLDFTVNPECAAQRNILHSSAPAPSAPPENSQVAKGLHSNFPKVGNSESRNVNQILAQNMSVGVPARPAPISHPSPAALCPTPAGHISPTFPPPSVPTGTLSQARIVSLLSDITEGEAIVAGDVGRHQMWLARFYRFKHPNSHLSSGGLGSMGYGLPAAMGAALGQPQREVWSISGDGGFMMNLQELGTLAEYNIPVHACIMEDAALGMVRQWQNLLFKGNISHSEFKNPDFVALANAFGIPAWRAYTYEEARKAIEEARKVKGPTLITFMVDPDEHVYPMVPPNTALGDQALCDADLLQDKVQKYDDDALLQGHT